jgi:hypothetical protein
MELKYVLSKVNKLIAFRRGRTWRLRVGVHRWRQSLSFTTGTGHSKLETTLKVEGIIYISRELLWCQGVHPGSARTTSLPKVQVLTEFPRLLCDLSLSSIFILQPPSSFIIMMVDNIIYEWERQQRLEM